MKENKVKSMIAMYDGAEWALTNILILTHENKDIETVKKIVRQTLESLPKEKAVWLDRLDNNGIWSGYAQNPRLIIKK